MRSGRKARTRRDDGVGVGKVEFTPVERGDVADSRQQARELDADLSVRAGDEYAWALFPHWATR